MTAPTRPEVWLRGPVPGIPSALQPVAHALLQSAEDVERACGGLGPALVWRAPGGAATIGFHLKHLAGSTERLFAYARGEALSAAQREALKAEREIPDPLPGGEPLVAAWRDTVARAVRDLTAIDPATLDDARAVGRARLPSTVRGLLFHAAEHAQRHTGQIITTAKILGAPSDEGSPAPAPAPGPSR